MPATPVRTRTTPSTSRPRAAGRARLSGVPTRLEPPHRPARALPPFQTHTPVQNRVPVLLVHIPRLSIRGQARLAAEVGVSRSTVSRLVGGKINPSYRLARGVTSALERMLGRPLDMRDVFTTDGTYPTPSGCGLCGCRGCLPEEAYDPEGDRRAEWKNARPGDWSLTPSAPSLQP